MEKTLYLNEHTTLSVIKDGPSVVITEEGKAGRRVPARVIQRVIITGNFKLETNIITLFTQHNVPVLFLDKRGNQIAVALPYNQRLPAYYKEQKTLLESDYNRKRFMTFLTATRQQVQIDVLKRLLKRQMPERYITVGLKEADYQQELDNTTSRYSEEFLHIRKVISSLFVEMVTGRLIASDLDPHIGIMHRRQDFGLVMDICHILGPECDLQSIQFCSGSKDNDHLKNKRVLSEDRKAIAVRFENRKEALAQMTEHIIDGIFEIIRELRISAETRTILI